MVSAAASRRHTDLSSSKYSIDPSLKTTLKGPFYGFTLKTSTWISDSHNLYDYESHYVSAKTYRCYGRSNEYRLIKKGIDVQLLTEDVAVSRLSEDNSVTSLALITALEDGGYRLESVSSAADAELRLQTADQPLLDDDEDRRFWLVARSVPSASLPLTAGDTIKLGRCTYKIKRIVLHTQGKPAGGSPEDETQSSSSDRTARETSPRSKESIRPPTLTNLNVDVADDSDLEETRRVANVSMCGSRVESVDSTMSQHDVAEHTPARVAIPDVLSYGKCCRICLCDEESPMEDPLLTPCTCKGSMQWVHLKCLRTWMQGRLGVNGIAEKQRCFFWEALECELCKAPYPTYVCIRGNTPQNAQPGADACEFKSNQDPIERVIEAAISATQRSEELETGQVVELFAIPKPTVPFIILECKQPNGSPGFYFLNFGPENMLKLGRGHEADARVADISVSRVHAVVRYQPVPGALLTVLREAQGSSSNLEAKEHGADANSGVARDSLGSIVLPIRAAAPYVYIEDMKSKFGTLIAVDKPIYLYPKMMVSIQVGRTVITMHVRKPTWSRLLPSCLNVNYKSLLPRLRRRTTLDGDQRDVRLLDSYLPIALSHTSLYPMASLAPDAGRPNDAPAADPYTEADPLAATRPTEF